MDENDTSNTLLSLKGKVNNDLTSNHTSDSSWNEILWQRALQEFETLYRPILNAVSNDHEEKDNKNQELVFLKESIGDVNILEAYHEGKG